MKKNALALAVGLGLVLAYERGRATVAALRLAQSDLRVTLAASQWARAAIAGDSVRMERAAGVLREEGLPW